MLLHALHVCCRYIRIVARTLGELHILIGLPGSGKTTWMEAYGAENPDHLLVDDYQKEAIAHCSDPQWSRHFGSVVEALETGREVLVSDIAFCQSSSLHNFVLLMKGRANDPPIVLHYFENNPQACKANVKARGRDGWMAEAAKVDELSSQYDPPSDAMPVGGS